MWRARWLAALAAISVRAVHKYSRQTLPLSWRCEFWSKVFACRKFLYHLIGCLPFVYAEMTGQQCCFASLFMRSLKFEIVSVCDSPQSGHFEECYLVCYILQILIENLLKFSLCSKPTKPRNQRGSI